jgi:catechol 2,3-dioxygenase-like lactoylglutathione lyase family enzyme
VPFNHIALATRDIDATHRFYTDVMGFRLAKVVAAPTPGDTGWARHVFYDCGGGEYVAFWDLPDETITGYPTDLNESIGLPAWVNHFAWNAADEDAYQGHLQRWRSCGITVAEIDHGFCKSIYTQDPNGILVEFCLMTAELGEDDEREARALLAANVPALETPPGVVFHEPLSTVDA